MKPFNASHWITIRRQFSSIPCISKSRLSLSTTQKSRIYWSQRTQYRAYSPRRDPRLSGRDKYESFQGTGRGRILRDLYKSGYLPYVILVTLGTSGAVYYINLETVPVTGRKRFNVFGPDFENSISDQQFQNVVNVYGRKILPPDHPYSQLARRVVSRLAPHSGLANQKWEVRVINEPNEMNAFALPG